MSEVQNNNNEKTKLCRGPRGVAQTLCAAISFRTEGRVKGHQNLISSRVHYNK